MPPHSSSLLPRLFQAASQDAEKLLALVNENRDLIRERCGKSADDALDYLNSCLANPGRSSADVLGAGTEVAKMLNALLEKMNEQRPLPAAAAASADDQKPGPGAAADRRHPAGDSEDGAKGTGGRLTKSETVHQEVGMDGDKEKGKKNRKE